MIGRYRDGVVPQAELDPALADDLGGLADTVAGQIDRVELTLALEEIWSRGVRRLNRYVEEQAPWTLAKDDSQSERLDQVLYSLAEGIRVLSVLLHPYIPRASGRLLNALGQGGEQALALENARAGAVAGGTAVAKLEPLFPKVEAVETA
jgi:methionyl-tRNA synthetase